MNDLAPTGSRRRPTRKTARTPGLPDPWTWLLSRAPSGAWRHAPFLAPEPGQGQDPASEPRVEVVRRLIAYPETAFAAVVHAVAAAERPEREARWVCFREPGNLPARPYWLCFVSVVPGGRRFHLGLELFDRERLGLWFFSGYDPAQVPKSLVTPFPSRPELLLPRLELGAGAPEVPLEQWIGAAWEDRLGFAHKESLMAPRPSSTTGSADQSHIIQASILAMELDAETRHPLLGLRASRARLLVFPPGAEPSIHAMARLSLVVGRDPRCDLVVDHRSVSKEHARIDWTREGAFAVTDLQSKNGTTIGGTRLVPGYPRPLPAPGEVPILLGEVPALLVIDPPAPSDGAPHPHAARLDALVKRGKLAPEARQAAEGEAESHGVGPGEVALLRKWVTLEEWQATGAGAGCLGLVLAAGALLLAGCALAP